MSASDFTEDDYCSFKLPTAIVLLFVFSTVTLLKTLQRLFLVFKFFWALFCLDEKNKLFHYLTCMGNVSRTPVYIKVKCVPGRTDPVKNLLYDF